MLRIFADVGGTNSRLAYATVDGIEKTSIQHFVNSEYGSFYDLLDAYLAQHKISDAQACCLAFAGPITAQRVSLTNIDWEISCQTLKSRYGFIEATIINDLTAIGYAIEKLPQSGVDKISSGLAKLDNNQSLVIGMGTGFNICPVKYSAQNQVTCFECEYGHSTLSSEIFETINKFFEGSSIDINSVEHVFSGRGLSKFHSAFTGLPEIRGESIVSNIDDKAPQSSKDTLLEFAHFLGVLVSDLILQYLPLKGIYFAGGASKGVFGFSSEFRIAFLKSLRENMQFNQEYADLPITLIKDENVALYGCEVYSTAHFTIPN